MNKTIIYTALLLATGVSNAAITHTMSDGRFDFVDASGVITDSGHDDVQGSFDMVNGTGTFDTTTPFNGVTWHADIVEMDMHNTIMGGTDTAAVENHTFGWTNLSFANASFTEFYNCRISDGGFNGCDASQTAGLYQLGAGNHNEYSYTLTHGQFAAGIFFDWATNADIPVLAIWQVAAQDPDGSMDIVSVGDSCSNDGTLCGTAMLTAPFSNQTPIFSYTISPGPLPLSEIPVPAAIWLFGSGLIGLIGFAKRKQA